MPGRKCFHGSVAVSAGIAPGAAQLKRSLLPSLLAFLEAGERKIDLWFARHRVALADFHDCPEAFVNVNSPDEHRALEARLRETNTC